MDLDQEFKDNHMDILKRFYLLFESIYKYVKGKKRGRGGRRGRRKKR